MIVAVLIAAISLPVLARGSGGRGGGGGRSAGHGHSGAHAHRAVPGGYVPRRAFAGPRVGVFLGAPLYAPLYYAPAPVYYIPPPAPVYIEKPPAALDSQGSADWGYWYYCPQSDIYYPYVNACPAGWQQVVPRPPEASLDSFGTGVSGEVPGALSVFPNTERGLP